jgi:hypothetical protein
MTASWSLHSNAQSSCVLAGSFNCPIVQGTCTELALPLAAIHTLADAAVQELKNILARQPGPEVAEQLSAYQGGLREKTKQMKAMASELNMYQAQARALPSARSACVDGACLHPDKVCD